MTDEMQSPEIACALDAEGQAARGRAFAELCPQSMQRSGNALIAHYLVEDEAAVRAFADAERACCPFLDISVELQGDAVVMRIAGSDDAQPVIDAFLSIPS
jgi:hypothetical protein